MNGSIQRIAQQYKNTTNSWPKRNKTKQEKCEKKQNPRHSKERQITIYLT